MTRRTLFSRFGGWALPAILCCAFLLRVVPVVVAPETIRGGRGPFGDTPAYLHLAENLIQGRGYSQDANGSEPSVLRPPLYAFFLAAILGLSRDGYTLCRVAQGVLDTATVALVYFSASRPAMGRLGAGRAGRRAGLLAALLAAACPYLVFYARQLLSETLTVFFVALALYLTMRAAGSRSGAAWLAAGAAHGAAALTRPDTGLLLLFSLPAAAVVFRAPLASRLRLGILMAAGFLVVLAPWIARNALVFGRLIPFAAGNSGFNLHIGTWEESSRWMAEGWNFPVDTPDRDRLEALRGIHERTGGASMLAPDAELFRIAAQRIRRDPVHYAGLMLKRIPRLWWFDPFPKYYYREPSRWFAAAFLALGAVGTAVLARQSGRWVLIPLVVVIYVTAVHVPMHVEARFSLQAFPALLVLAGWAACVGTGKTSRDAVGSPGG